MATRSKRPAREDARHTTVAYRGHELDELIAASSEIPVLSQTEMLESLPTVAQAVMELEDDDYELAPPSREETDFEPIPESVPVVESTVVIANAAELRQELSQPAAPVSAFDSQRPVAYSVPSCPSTSILVPPIAYTVGDGIESTIVRTSSRAPALITLTIAVVAITVGVLLGSSFSRALSQPPRASAAAAPSAPAAPSSTETNPAEAAPAPPRHAEPRSGVDEKLPLANAGVVREKAMRPSKPIGMMIGQRRSAPQAGSQAAFEAELRSKMEKAEKPSADALGEAQLNRPF